MVFRSSNDWKENTLNRVVWWSLLHASGSSMPMPRCNGVLCLPYPLEFTRFRSAEEEITWVSRFSTAFRALPFSYGESVLQLRHENCIIWKKSHCCKSPIFPFQLYFRIRQFAGLKRPKCKADHSPPTRLIAYTEANLPLLWLHLK